MIVIIIISWTHNNNKNTSFRKFKMQMCVGWYGSHKKYLFIINNAYAHHFIVYMENSVRLISPFLAKRKLKLKNIGWNFFPLFRNAKKFSFFEFCSETARILLFTNRWTWWCDISPPALMKLPLENLRKKI